MPVNWEVRRRQIAAWQALVMRCLATYDASVAAGKLLSRTQVIYLLLDEHSDLRDQREARNAIAQFPAARRGFHA